MAGCARWLAAGLLSSGLLGSGAVLAAPGASPAAAAPSVALAGVMGQRQALLVINGQPRTLSVGQSAGGVTLWRLAADAAEVSVGGRRQVLALGAGAQALGAVAAASARGAVIELNADGGGHFTAAGQINGRPVRFLVDTGATQVALGQAEATRLGLEWRSGRPAHTLTANGPVPIHQIMLSSVKVEGVEVANVAASVLPTDMPMVLLGNSFLERFNLRREGQRMRLERRP